MSNRRHVTWYHAIWISDVHLGTRGCKAEQLLDFLSRTESKFLYLVGDIIDGWRLQSNFYWPQSHSNALRRLLTLMKRGTRLVFATANHDVAASRRHSCRKGPLAAIRRVSFPQATRTASRFRLAAQHRLGRRRPRSPCGGPPRIGSRSGQFSGMVVGSRSVTAESTTTSWYTHALFGQTGSWRP